MAAGDWRFPVHETVKLRHKSLTKRGLGPKLCMELVSQVADPSLELHGTSSKLKFREGNKDNDNKKINIDELRMAVSLVSPGDPLDIPARRASWPRSNQALDGCDGFDKVRATSYPLTTRDPQGRQQAETPLRGYKVGLLRHPLCLLEAGLRGKGAVQ